MKAQPTIYDRIEEIDTAGLIVLVRNWTNSVMSGDNKSGGYHARCLNRAILELERRGVLPCPSAPMRKP